MSDIPMLTPVETPIFDDQLVEELEKHWEDELQCEACETVASSRVSHRCCNFGIRVCDHHLHIVEKNVAERCAANARLKCVKCGREFTNPAPDDLFKVVPL